MFMIIACTFISLVFTSVPITGLPAHPERFLTRYRNPSQPEEYLQP